MAGQSDESVELYYRTTPQKARAILRDGFRDESCPPYRGVWLTDRPLTDDDCAHPGESATVVVSMRRAVMSAALFWGGVGGGPARYRRWLMPALVLNALARVFLLGGDA